MTCGDCGAELTTKPAVEVLCPQYGCFTYVRIGECCAARDGNGVRALANHVHRVEIKPEDKPAAAGSQATVSTRGMTGAKPGQRRPWP